MRGGQTGGDRKRGTDGGRQREGKRERVTETGRQSEGNIETVMESRGTEKRRQRGDREKGTERG